MLEVNLRLMGLFARNLSPFIALCLVFGTKCLLLGAEDTPRKSGGVHV
jgi:hypothetical protein